MKGFTNESSLQHNIFDAAGERVLKTHASVTNANQNASAVVSGYQDWDTYSMYPNGYVSVDNKGMYTKHYFNGSSRVMSRVGTGTAWTNLGSTILGSLRTLQQEDLKRTFDLSALPTFKTFTPETGTDQRYYFHSDHLGTATYLTDNFGKPTETYKGGSTKPNKKIDKMS